MLHKTRIHVAFLVALSVSLLSGIFIWLNKETETVFSLSAPVFGFMNFLFNFVFIYILLNKYVKNKQSSREQIAVLKENERYRKEFLGNVSHELKTPVFNMQGYILTLLDGGIDDPTINCKYLKRTEQNINRMISVINDLETISKLEAHELKLEFSDFDILKVVREVIDMLEMSAAKHNIKLSCMSEKDSIRVHADKNRITEVLLNLVANSIRYGISSGKTNISIKENRAVVYINVIDNGIGIKPKHLNRIFERFYRVDKSRSKKLGGTGLGLSIVKHIIDAHKQNITVKSKANIGTTFTFTLNKSK